MIFVNFKTYEEGSGQAAINLAHSLEAVSEETQIKIIPVVQAADVKEVTQSVKIPVWVQHIDPVEFGAHTGSILPEAVFEDGAQGTFLNHSENKFTDFEMLKKAVERAHSVGLKTLIFANNMAEIEKITTLNPTYISYEPAELVGSTDISVSTAHPDIIAKASDYAREHGIPLIIGAGVHSAGDIKTGLSLGAAGFAIATNVVKADNPKQALLNLIDGYKG